MNSINEWVHEISSGYAGYRCRKCGTWVFNGETLICNCKKENKMKYKAIKVKHFNHWIWFEWDKVETKDGYFTGRDGVGKFGSVVSISIPQELIEGSMMSDSLHLTEED